MGIEIGPFCCTCTECGQQIAINRHAARSPEAMVVFANNIAQTHRCRKTAPQAATQNMDDRWTQLLAQAKADLHIN